MDIGTRVLNRERTRKVTCFEIQPVGFGFSFLQSQFSINHPVLPVSFAIFYWKTTIEIRNWRWWSNDTPNAIVLTLILKACVTVCHERATAGKFHKGAVMLKAVQIRIQTESVNKMFQKDVPVTPNLWPFLTICDICEGHKLVIFSNLWTRSQMLWFFQIFEAKRQRFDQNREQFSFCRFVCLCFKFDLTKEKTL